MDQRCRNKEEGGVKNNSPGNSLAVQWLRLHAFTAEGLGLIRGRGTKIPQATWHGPKKKKKKEERTAALVQVEKVPLPKMKNT